MKILLFTTHLDIGGIAVYTVNVARYLKRKGVDVAVCSSGGGLEKILRKENIPHMKIGIRTKAEFGPGMWLNLPAFVRIVKGGGFDLIHAQTRVTQVMAHLAKIFTRVPYVATCHGFYSHGRAGRRLLPCWGELTIAISENVASHLTDDFKLPRKRVRKIHTGIELARYAGAKDKKDDLLAREIGLRKDLVTIGTVGRFSSVKGQRHLLEAFGEVVASGLDAQLLFVGDEGAEKERLRKMTDGKGLKDKVFFEDGEKAPLEKYLALFDVFCLPSLQEGLGLSLMEAMAAGCASVASNVGGVPELVDDGASGLLVPPGDAASLARSIRRLAEDRALRERLGRSAQAKALGSFGIEESVEKLIEVYREVLDADKHEARISKSETNPKS